MILTCTYIASSYLLFAKWYTILISAKPNINDKTEIEMSVEKFMHNADSITAHRVESALLLVLHHGRFGRNRFLLQCSH